MDNMSLLESVFAECMRAQGFHEEADSGTCEFTLFPEIDRSICTVSCWIDREVSVDYHISILDEDYCIDGEVSIYDFLHDQNNDIVNLRQIALQDKQVKRILAIYRAFQADEELMIITSPLPEVQIEHCGSFLAFPVVKRTMNYFPKKRDTRLYLCLSCHFRDFRISLLKHKGELKNRIRIGEQFKGQCYDLPTAKSVLQACKDAI